MIISASGKCYEASKAGFWDGERMTGQLEVEVRGGVYFFSQCLRKASRSDVLAETWVGRCYPARRKLGEEYFRQREWQEHSSQEAHTVCW